MAPLRVILNLRREFYFIFSCSQARKKIFKKFRLRHRLPLRLRHLILQFGRKNKTYVLKNKNKIKKQNKVIPYQCKRLLSKDILTAWAHWQWKTALFFGVLFARGGFTSSTLG